MTDILVVRGLRKEFGGLVAVNDVDFTIPERSIVSLIGPNGAGKTTMFNMLTGVYKPTAGTIEFAGEDVTGKPPHAVTERGVGRTFQNIRLFNLMTARENVLVGMHARLGSGIIKSVLRTPGQRREERRAHERARELLAYSGLRGQYEDFARNLSYGDQRRLEVARALATDPKLLLLDEPTAGMNPQETAEFTAFVARLREELELTVLMIEHDMKVVMGRTARPGDVVTLAQPELAGELDRDVGVLTARQIALDAEEAVALVAHVDVSGDLDGLVAHYRRRFDVGLDDRRRVVALRPVGSAATALAAAAAAAVTRLTVGRRTGLRLGARAASRVGGGVDGRRRQPICCADRNSPSRRPGRCCRQ